MEYIDVKAMAQEILDGVAEKMKTVENPKSLLILHAGDDPASASYMKGKIKDCERCGIPYRQIKCLSMAELISYIAEANDRRDVGGIIVQLPLPEGWDEGVVNLVKPSKDVDGFVAGSRFHPCTPEGIVHIMKKDLDEEDLSGLDVVLVGKGKLIGKPLIPMLLEEGVTLTVCHSRTANLGETIDRVKPEVVIAATGKPGSVNLYHCRMCSLVIDAGISRVDGKLVGDCCRFDPNYEPWCHVTPVPGGVGLMTRAMLMKHMAEVQG